MKRSVLAVGATHACAIVSGGGLKCWGSNVDGELGDGSEGSEAHAASAVDVVGLSSGVVSVSAGGHTCAITELGGLKCWGSNTSGELGNPDPDYTPFSTEPIDVVGLSSGVVAVSVGGSATCAITDAGALLCWGYNAWGQLGDGSTVERDVPTPVVGLSSGVLGVSTSGGSTCAILSGGALKCWGNNEAGQLGDGSTQDSAVPVDVVGLSSGVVSVSVGGGSACAVTNTGALECWGTGMLGDGIVTHVDDVHVPVEVAGAWSTVVPVDVTAETICAVTAAGALKCWGVNGAGQLGNGTEADSLVPADVKGFSAGVVAFGAGIYHTCAAIPGGGGVRCWGSNTYHALGDGTDVPKRTEPVDVEGL